MLIWILIGITFISLLTAALMWSRFYHVHRTLRSVQQEHNSLLRDLIPPERQNDMRTIYDRAWAGEVVQYESGLNGDS
ncbi:hypothetical protein A8990_110122 [Paenibacillus taihuensis]|uniref:Uncharacterized protein n=1 Tax=Paenibacillus taihuensis TaxID=1156355 RepID=A0A3D9SAB1_9BACL|nr:hypothetical protein A8990_110122 [Paenibacillus taihuensis]